MNNVFFSASAQHHGQTVSEKQWDSVCFGGFLLSCSCVSASLSQKSSFTLQRLVRSSFEQAACQHATLTFTRTCRAQRYSLVTEWKNTFFFAYRLPRNVIWEGNASKPIPNMKLSYIYSLANGLFFFYNTQQLYNQWLISQITLRDAKTGYYFCQEMGEGLYLFNYVLPFLWR